MTSVVLAQEVAQDVARIVRHLSAHDVTDINERIDEIFEALQFLANHPEIGRPAQQGQRELVIGKGSRGYVARYRFDPIDDEVRVTALRSQREAGFEDR